MRPGRTVHDIISQQPLVAPSSRPLPRQPPSTDLVHLSVPAKFPDGWEANQVMLTKLAQHRVAA
ncbi:hypothetical protein [Streptomyces anulatus]|uniref:hypothetical protein n=1 Tax=Streptomyces anulatus TaxID=1892 RepID=UPI003721C8BC